jgi:hypothetical protein
VLSEVAFIPVFRKCDVCVECRYNLFLKYQHSVWLKDSEKASERFMCNNFSIERFILSM